MYRRQDCRSVRGRRLPARGQLFHQLFKLFLLLRRQNGANMLAHILHDLAKLWRDELPKVAIAFLALGDDFPDFFALLRRQA